MKKFHSNWLSYINKPSLCSFTLPDDGFLQKPKRVAVKLCNHSCHWRVLFPRHKLCIVTTASYVQVIPPWYCGQLSEVSVLFGLLLQFFKLADICQDHESLVLSGESIKCHKQVRSRRVEDKFYKSSLPVGDRYDLIRVTLALEL